MTPGTNVKGRGCPRHDENTCASFRLKDGPRGSFGGATLWHRINDLPDYVYFNHAIHIAKGIGCAECHGQVDRMPLMRKVHGFTMGFCINCHADPAPRLRPKDQIFNLEWHRTADTPSPAALMAQYHIGNRRLTDCTICHR